jgi:coenzyme Q-binding protein COQ10
VTARDKKTGYPSQAFLTVGYGPFTETFTSRVTCDRDNWTVEARSGGGVGDDGKPIPGAEEGLFSHLSTKWELVPRPSASSVGAAGAGAAETEVRLEIRFRFQNPMHTAMMSAVEDKVAGVMIEAFERRIKEQMTLGR